MTTSIEMNIAESQQTNSSSSSSSSSNMNAQSNPNTVAGPGDGRHTEANAVTRSIDAEMKKASLPCNDTKHPPPPQGSSMKKNSKPRPVANGVVGGDCGGSSSYNSEDEEFDWIHRLDAPILVLRRKAVSGHEHSNWSVVSCNDAATETVSGKIVYDGDDGDDERTSTKTNRSLLRIHLSSHSERLLMETYNGRAAHTCCTVGIETDSNPSALKTETGTTPSSVMTTTVRQFRVHIAAATSAVHHRRHPPNERRRLGGNGAIQQSAIVCFILEEEAPIKLLQQTKNDSNTATATTTTQQQQPGLLVNKQRYTNGKDDESPTDADDRNSNSDPSQSVSIIHLRNNIDNAEEGSEQANAIMGGTQSTMVDSSRDEGDMTVHLRYHHHHHHHQHNNGAVAVVDESYDDEYRMIIETSCSLIFGVDLHGRVNEWNQSMEHMTGISKYDAIGFPLFSSIAAPPDPSTVPTGGGSGSDDDHDYGHSIAIDIDNQSSADGDSKQDDNDEFANTVKADDYAYNNLNPMDHKRNDNMKANVMQRISLSGSIPAGGREYDDIQEEFQTILYNALYCGRGTSNFELELKILPSNDKITGNIPPPPPFEEQDDNFVGHDDEMDDGQVEMTVETRFLLTSVSPRRDVHGGVIGAIVIAIDITEACNHDRAVAAMASELRQLIDTANACVFGCDCEGDVNEWNDKTAEVTGYTKDEAFDCPLVETFIVPELQASVQDMLDNALEGRATSNYELEFRTKAQEVRHLLVNFTPQRDMDNFIVGVVAIAQDVTEAVQRDRAVAGMALELRQLIDTANAPICGIDIEGNINEWNNRMSEVTGYSKEESFDENLVDFCVAPSMRDEVEEILASALAGNETSNYELEFVSKSGEPIFLLVNATTRRDPSNDVVGVVGVAQDVTEDRKHARELREMQALRASQEAKVETERNMTAYFAHELRNPLGAIDSALNAMPDDLPESARSLVAGMQLCTGFMSSIMNNLLDVRKMEEGKMRLARTPISLHKLVKSVHKMLMPSVRKGVDFRIVEKQGGLDWVLGDAHRIQQVLTNVVTNAIKYTVTGYIEMSLGWDGDYVTFACEDTGPGIPKSEQEKLFQRFVQRGGAPGTGLGLAIAKNLVDLVGGTIRFDSDPSVKAGTTCIVRMKLELCEPPECTVEEDTTLIEEPLSFLIIDDIKMNRMMLKRRIMKGIAPNASIKEAATGEEALEICGSEKFDVIIVDQYMEEAGGIMVGTDVVFAMRRMKIDSIVIGCSGNDLEGEFKESGADWVWQKPLPSNTRIIQELRTSMIRRGN